MRKARALVTLDAYQENLDALLTWRSEIFQRSRRVPVDAGLDTFEVHNLVGVFVGLLDDSTAISTVPIRSCQLSSAALSAVADILKTIEARAEPVLHIYRVSRGLSRSHLIYCYTWRKLLFWMIAWFLRRSSVSLEVRLIMMRMGCREGCK